MCLHVVFLCDVGRQWRQLAVICTSCVSYLYYVPCALMTFWNFDRAITLWTQQGKNAIYIDIYHLYWLRSIFRLCIGHCRVYDNNIKVLVSRSSPTSYYEMLVICYPKKYHAWIHWIYRVLGSFVFQHVDWWTTDLLQHVAAAITFPSSTKSPLFLLCLCIWGLPVRCMKLYLGPVSCYTCFYTRHHIWLLI